MYSCQYSQVDSTLRDESKLVVKICRTWKFWWAYLPSFAKKIQIYISLLCNKRSCCWVDSPLWVCRVVAETESSDFTLHTCDENFGHSHLASKSLLNYVYFAESMLFLKFGVHYSSFCCLIFLYELDIWTFFILTLGRETMNVSRLTQFLLLM